MLALVGKNSILLKASAGTNFTYRLAGEEPSALNSDKANRGVRIAERIRYVRERGFALEFVGIERGELFGNLQLLDSGLPKIIAYLVEYMYAGDARTNLVALLEHLKLENPLEFDMSEGHPFYEHKVKRFLVALARGMTASNVWTGEFDRTRGPIAVETTDNRVLNDFYDYGEFEEYLLDNTRLEQASTSRYKFGEFYCEGRDVLIRLNLQMRFI